MAAAVHSAQKGSQVILYVEPPLDLPRALLPIVSDTLSRLAHHTTLGEVNIVLRCSDESQLLQHPLVRYVIDSYELTVSGFSYRQDRQPTAI